MNTREDVYRRLLAIPIGYDIIAPHLNTIMTWVKDDAIMTWVKDDAIRFDFLERCFVDYYDYSNCNIEVVIGVSKSMYAAYEAAWIK